MPEDVDPDALTSIRNIGPAFAEALIAVGIPTASALRAQGADAAYRKVLAGGTKPHFISYYVLHMALQGRPWNDCKGAEKDALRAQFDAIKTEMAGQRNESGIEKLLDEIGVGQRRT